MVFSSSFYILCSFFFFQAEDGIRDTSVTGVQTCALPISLGHQLERQLVDPSRQVGIPVALERPVPLQVLEDLGEVIPRDVVLLEARDERSEERRVGKECRSRWWRYC